jgi:hypothetical protein
MAMKLTSKKSYRVIEHLLQNPETSQLGLSNETGVALGHVNKIINYLHDLNMVSIKSRSCILTDPARLLEKISFERPLKRLEANTFRLPTTSIVETEKILNNACYNNNVDYALTSFSGLRRYYEYHISYPHIHAYASDPELERKIGRGEGAIPVTLLNPDRPEILADSREIDGLRACDRVQIVVDLFSGGYGRDAAVKFLEVIQDGAEENTG